MAVVNRRNRTVVFRVTQEEYAALRAVSSNSGARNISDFVRTTLLASIGTAGTIGSESLTEMSRTLAGLKDAVGRVAEKMEQISSKNLSSQEVKKR
jgi:hypothetical protein